MTIQSKIFAALSGAWSLFIFSNSLKPGEASSQMSDGIVTRVAQFLSDLGVPFDTETITIIIRKGAHFAEFLLLGLLISLGFYFAKTRFVNRIPIILFLCLSAGVTDEFIQSFIVGRSSEVRDVLIDFSGAVLGLLIVLFLAWRKQRRPSRGRYNALRFRD